MTRFAIFVFWLLHFMPLPLLAPVGKMLGMVLFVLGRARRRIARTNLRLCFPELAEARREKLLRAHFRAFGQSLLDRGILWWSSRRRLDRVVRIEGLEHWQAVQDRPVVWLAPHFVGLDMGGIRLAADHPGVSMYSRQKIKAVDDLLLHARTRFSPSLLVSRQEGLKPVIKAMKRKLPFYYLPDMDFGPRDAEFVPFFGVPAATITALPRLVKLTGAAVVPVITRQLPGGKGYVTRLYPAWTDFPSDDPYADTLRMNRFIEERVREMPEQYFWLHKRFKTRPPGESPLYGKGR